MTSGIYLDCPKCKTKIKINLFACKEGTEILCPKCESMIKLHFEGDTPKRILEKMKKDIERECNKVSGKITLRF